MKIVCLLCFMEKQYSQLCLKQALWNEWEKLKFTQFGIPWLVTGNPSSCYEGGM